MAKQQNTTDTTSNDDNDTTREGGVDRTSATAPRDDSKSPEQGLAENDHGDQVGTDAVRIAIENTHSGVQPQH